MQPCDTCGQPANETHMHHVLPRSLGGVDATSNLVDVCLACHGRLHEMGAFSSSALIKAGIQRVVAAGGVWGRPSKITDKQRSAIREARTHGKTFVELAREFGLSVGTVHNICREQA